MLIYWLLFYTNAQVLQDLDRYQVKKYGYHIQKPERGPLQVEPLEEIAREMAKPPSRSRE